MHSCLRSLRTRHGRLPTLRLYPYVSVCIRDCALQIFQNSVAVAQDEFAFFGRQLEGELEYFSIEWNPQYEFFLFLPGADPFAAGAEEQPAGRVRIAGVAVGGVQAVFAD